AKEITTPEQTPPSDKDLGGRWSNIVRLPGTGATPAATPERLTGIERDAFRRIAEALGAQVTQAQKQIAAEPAKPDREPSSSDGPPAQVVPTPDRKLLDRLPIGIVVFRGATILFANRTLLDLLGYDSEAEFAAAGGGDTLFPDGAPNWERPDLGGSNGQLTARRKEGGQLAVEARLQAVTWADATALMVPLRECPPRRETETAPDHLLEEITGIE